MWLLSTGDVASEPLRSGGHEIHAGFQRLGTQKRTEYLTSDSCVDFYIGYMLKLYFGYVGLILIKTHFTCYILLFNTKLENVKLHIWLMLCFC